LTLVTAGRVGKAHGRDGSFYLEELRAELELGSTLHLAGHPHKLIRLDGTDDRPLVKLEGVEDPAAVRGELLLIEDELEEGEYLAADLIGCEVPGLGRVERVLDAPSCPLLEVGEDGHLIPMIGDAVKQIDLERKVIEVDRDFLGF
jgi:ribosomal 30S subunit maturation factor RimM